MNADLPTEIKLHKQSSTLELVFANDVEFRLSSEYLRVHSPSAEVRGHGKGQEVLQIGKRRVKLVNIEIVGNYAIKLIFDDGHETGIYSWSYLRELSTNQDQLWNAYLSKLEANGASRDELPPGVEAINIMPLSTE
tara:strand:- start:6 stop:413 length:408 start_codon:yes stop_codon:yes gene_type:complete